MNKKVKSLSDAVEQGLQWRCFHCLTFHKEKPERCPYCGCPSFTHISRCEKEDLAIWESAQKAAEADLSGKAIETIASLEIRRIQSSLED